MLLESGDEVLDGEPERIRFRTPEEIGISFGIEIPSIAE